MQERGNERNYITRAVGEDKEMSWAKESLESQQCDDSDRNTMKPKIEIEMLDDPKDSLIREVQSVQNTKKNSPRKQKNKGLRTPKKVITFKKKRASKIKILTKKISKVEGKKVYHKMLK